MPFLRCQEAVKHWVVEVSGRVNRVFADLMPSLGKNVCVLFGNCYLRAFITVCLRFWFDNDFMYFSFSIWLLLLLIFKLKEILIAMKLASVEGHDMLLVAWLRHLWRIFTVLAQWQRIYNMSFVDLVITNEQNLFNGRTDFASWLQHCILLPAVKFYLRLYWNQVFIGVFLTPTLWPFWMLG